MKEQNMPSLVTGILGQRHEFLSYVFTIGSGGFGRDERNRMLSLYDINIMYLVRHCHYSLT